MEMDSENPLLKDSDTKMLFDLVIVNLGVRNPNLERILAL